MTLHQDLQRLIEKEAAKANTHAVLLGVQSGDGRIDFRGSAGAHPSDRFLVASIAKMFTATLILRLNDRGMLSLDTPLQSILDTHDLSDLHTINGQAFGPSLTVRHLLQQTSGLADYYENELVATLKRGEDRAFDLTDVLRWTKALPPQAQPDSGSAYYSDTNYQLLGTIIETVTQRTFGDVLSAEICAPLNLAKTSVFHVSKGQQPDLVSLYHRDRQLNLPLALLSMGPDGGIVSNLDDLLVFLRAYMAGNLFSQADMEEVRNFRKLFFTIRYGSGLMRFKLPRWLNLFRDTPELIGHSGSTGSFAFYAPDSDIHLVGSFNQMDNPKRPFGFMMKVLQIVSKHEARR